MPSSGRPHGSATGADLWTNAAESAACGRLVAVARAPPGDRRGPYAGPMAPTAAFFDLDKTIIAKSSTLAFSKPFQAGGLISRRAVLRSAYAQFVYLVGGADHDQMEKLRQFMSSLVAGWDVATVREIVAETLHHVVDPIVYDEAVSLIAEHQLAGRDVVIVSASGTEVVEPIGALLGADHVIASRLEEVDGKYTGEIDRYVYAEEKAVAIRALAEERGYDLARVLRLQRLGHRRADARGRRPPARRQPRPRPAPAAAARGWPVLVFTKPVALRSARAAAAGQADARRARGRWRRRGRRCAVGQRPQASTRLTARSTLQTWASCHACSAANRARPPSTRPCATRSPWCPASPPTR